MRIVVTGASGLIGRNLTAALLDRGDEVTALTRDPGRAAGRIDARAQIASWPDPLVSEPGAELLSGADGVVHLLGEPVSQRWSEQARRQIELSRVASTRNLVKALGSLPAASRPRVLVSQSATGYYGPRGDEEVTETTAPGSDFLAGVVINWEAEASKAEDLLRVVRTRTGVVLDKDEGALAKMLPIFRIGIGGPVGSGRQYVPWIHLDDIVGVLIRALDDEQLSGAVNATAPNPVTNHEFSRAIGRALHRPAVAPVPAAAVRLLYGRMSEIVLTGQRAVPARLMQAAHAFAYSEIDAAFEDLLGGAAK